MRKRYKSTLLRYTLIAPSSSALSYSTHGNRSFRDKPVLALACGQYHTLVSLEGGGVYACGKNDYGQLGIEWSEPRCAPVRLSTT